MSIFILGKLNHFLLGNRHKHLLHGQFYALYQLCSSYRIYGGIGKFFLYTTQRCMEGGGLNLLIPHRGFFPW